MYGVVLSREVFARGPWCTKSLNSPPDWAATLFGQALESGREVRHAQWVAMLGSGSIQKSLILGIKYELTVRKRSG